MSGIFRSPYLTVYGSTFVGKDLVADQGALLFRRDRKRAERLAKKARRNGRGPRADRFMSRRQVERRIREAVALDLQGADLVLHVYGRKGRPVGFGGASC